ncbi:uncharacterized protein LOC119101148 [Pollicipes pollicipes]|uniref:uncharacterized protein LOC119101148 n=1 Tax=Pollicipes pollicipes TaxID=41117 RepID=UPI00188595E8|nr:uncharacterized protein LOC119101148 [Pollicipes pollicipes]
MSTGRARSGGRRMRGGVLLLGAAILFVCFGMSAGKRFDCQVFCKSTGFSGMIGGCRCSFTLFTSKRSQRARVAPGLDASMPEVDNMAGFASRLGVREPERDAIIPYLFFPNVRDRGQKEVMEDTDFQGKNDLVFGNMYQ